VTAAAASADMLRFPDGQTISGRLVREEAGVVVFSSASYGELRVPAHVVQVERGDATASPTSPPSTTPAVADAPPASPAKAPSAWRGRFALSAEDRADQKQRSEWSLELRLERKSPRYELRLEPRYELRREDGKAETDRLRVQAYARRVIARDWFALYRPVFVLDRQLRVKGTPAEYWLLAHELGGGRELVNRPGRELRVGFSAQLYQIEFYGLDESLHVAGPVIFLEADWDLPWATHLRNRTQAVHYPRFDQSGFVNELELTKKVTESLSLSVRHEYRQVSPDPRLESYRRLRLLLGYSF
jgi:hypothetical protein